MPPSNVIGYCDIHPMDMDVSDLSSCGESNGRSKLTCRRRVSGKDRSTKKTRHRRRNKKEGRYDPDDSKSSPEGGELRPRRAVTVDTPLINRRRESSSTCPPVPPLRRASTEGSGFSQLTLAPSVPRRRPSITSETVATTEHDESGYDQSLQVSVHAVSFSESRYRRNQSMTSLPSMPTSRHSYRNRRYQSIDSLPVIPMPSRTAVQRSSLPPSEPTFRRDQSMDSLPSLPRRRPSVSGYRSSIQSNAVW